MGEPTDEQIRKLRENAAEGTKGSQFYPVGGPFLIAMCDELLRLRADLSAPGDEYIVTCSLRYPDHCSHVKQAACEIETPHLISECGMFIRALLR